MYPRSTLSLALTAALTGLVGLGGCDFFQELESLPDAGADDESGDEDQDQDDEGETGEDEPCDVLDERCPTQDSLLTCNYESGELQTVDCASSCLANGKLNFSCAPLASYEYLVHGCWCADPGDIQLDTCTALEACLDNCGGEPNACAVDCFPRADANTIRLLGSLYHCADRACDDVCEASPADCGSCVLAARAGLWGDCGVERTVCDADQGDEPSWP